MFTPIESFIKKVDWHIRTYLHRCSTPHILSAHVATTILVVCLIMGILYSILVDGVIVCVLETQDGFSSETSPFGILKNNYLVVVHVLHSICVKRSFPRTMLLSRLSYLIVINYDRISKHPLIMKQSTDILAYVDFVLHTVRNGEENCTAVHRSGMHPDQLNKRW